MAHEETGKSQHEKEKSTDVIPKITQILELNTKDLKATITTMLQ